MNSNPIFKYTIGTFLLLGIVISCSSLENSSELSVDPSQGIDRPLEPWVFRSVLDKKPRMITIALDQNLFVAYSAENGTLYKAWKGGVELDGAVYTTHHGPQPTSIGNDYFVNMYPQPWKLYKNGTENKLTVKYAGHRFENNEVTLLYNLIGENEVFRLEEQPRYKTTGSGVPIFERSFSSSSLPEGYTITFMTNYASLMRGDAGIRTNGTWKFDDDAGVGIKKELTLNPTGNTTLTLLLTEPTIINEAVPIANNLNPAQTLINAHDCRSCHNEKLKTVGPAYIKIAEKYPNNEDNIASLMNKVKYGGVGVWGESVMNAHPEISDDDLRVMVSYIMDLDADEEAIKATLLNTDPISDKELVRSKRDVSIVDLDNGLKTEVYRFEGDKNSITDIDFSQAPAGTDALEFIDMAASEFGDLQDKFALVCTGYLKVEKDQRLVLRIASDDGSRLFLHGKELINNDGIFLFSMADFFFR